MLEKLKAMLGGNKTVTDIALETTASLQEAMQENQQLKAECAGAGQRISELSEKLAASESAIAALREQLQACNDELAKLRANNAELNADLKTAKDTLALTHIPTIAGTAPVDGPPKAEEVVFTREQIQRMTPAVYKKHRDAIIKAMNMGRIK